MIVNKPDYFEQMELTYLGFNNDFSEIPNLNSNLSSSIKADDYIAFQGDRELHVIVNPSSFTGTII